MHAHTHTLTHTHTHTDTDTDTHTHTGQVQVDALARTPGPALRRIASQGSPGLPYSAESDINATLSTQIIQYNHFQQIRLHMINDRGLV